MPVLKQKQEKGKEDEWYLHVPNKPGHAPPVYTFQLKGEGRDMLLDMGLTHKSDVDWGTYSTLNALGLLYTLNTDIEPGDVLDADDRVFDKLQELSPKQRQKFVLSLLARYPLSRLCQSEAVYRLICSAWDDGIEYSEPVLSSILESTPFDAVTISGSSKLAQLVPDLNDSAKPEDGNGIHYAVCLHFLYTWFNEGGSVAPSCDSDDWEPFLLIDDAMYCIGGTDAWNSFGTVDSTAVFPSAVASRGIGKSVTTFMETVFSPLTVHQLIQTLAESERDYFATLLVNGFGFEMGVFPEPNAYEKFFHESPTPFRVVGDRSSSDSISLPTQNS